MSLAKDALELFKDSAVKELTGAVGSVTRSLSRLYSQVKYAGFVSVTGVLLLLSPPIFQLIPRLNMEPGIQKWYFISGMVLLFLGGAWILCQNMIIMHLTIREQELRYRILALQVSAIGEAQKVATHAVTDNTPATPHPPKFKDK